MTCDEQLNGADMSAIALESLLPQFGELTPLMHAALMGQPLMVRFLIDAGADQLALSGPSLMHPPLTLRGLLAQEKGPRSKKIQEILEMLEP